MGIFMLTMMLVMPIVKSELVIRFPIRYVRVAGALQYITQESIDSVIEPLVATGYFFVDLHAIQAALMTLSWSKQVTVKRVWPDRIELIIQEREPEVRWGDNGLLNSEGVIFIPQNMDKFKMLPILSVPEKQRVEFLNIMRKLTQELAVQGLKLQEFVVSERQAWLLKMEKGLWIQLGKDQPLENFKKLMKVFVVSGQDEIAKMAYVDMRYPNGYAVRWRVAEK